jgi:PAS domain S-box-containing protein
MGDSLISLYDQPQHTTLAEQAPTTPDGMIVLAMHALQNGMAALEQALESLPVPIYLTDADGWVTYHNRACVDFTGRTPLVGGDRWCVSWKLFHADGRPLPHEHCPMAVAIREERPVRGAVAVAERPDGTRVMFTPYPTPLRDEAGEIVGAVNILIDLTDARQAASLRAQADRCRRLAQSMTDQQAIDALHAMTAEYETKAQKLTSPRG